jgi:hypothetical protein
LPLTVAVPTVVPPEVQVVGAVDWGPKTAKVMVPVALEPEVAPSTPEIEVVAMAVPAAPPAGPDAVRAVLAMATTVLDMPEPQVDTAELLLESPAYDAYHQ